MFLRSCQEVWTLESWAVDCSSDEWTFILVRFCNSISLGQIYWNQKGCEGVALQNLYIKFAVGSCVGCAYDVKQLVHTDCCIAHLSDTDRRALVALLQQINHQD